MYKTAVYLMSINIAPAPLYFQCHNNLDFDHQKLTNTMFD